MALDKTRVAIAVLVILLAIAVGYITFDKMQAKRAEEQTAIYQQGLQTGYEQAIIQIMQQAANCEQVPLYAENDTINLVAVECLQNSAK